MQQIEITRKGAEVKEMEEKLVMINRSEVGPGCNFSHSDLANTWMVNIRITESQRFPYVCCDRCSRRTCFRNPYGRMACAAY